MPDIHEPLDKLSPECLDFHRALTSLKEEIEAVDWYHQRVEACSDPALKRILQHNRDEEIEHACMTLEWLRQNMNAWDENLRKFLFAAGEHSSGAEHVSAVTTAGTASGLGLGKLSGEQI